MCFRKDSRENPTCRKSPKDPFTKPEKKGKVYPYTPMLIFWISLNVGIKGILINRD